MQLKSYTFLQQNPELERDRWLAWQVAFSLSVLTEGTHRGKSLMEPNFTLTSFQSRQVTRDMPRDLL